MSYEKTKLGSLLFYWAFCLRDPFLLLSLREDLILRPILIAGNWKMHKTQAEAREFLQELGWLYNHRPQGQHPSGRSSYVCPLQTWRWWQSKAADPT